MMIEIQNHFRAYADSLFATLAADENLILQLKGEDSLFLRWNRGKIRQTTQVRQFDVNWTFQKEGRQFELGEQLTLDLDSDTRRGRAQIERLRAEAKTLAPSHQLAPIVPASSSVRIGEMPKRDPARIAAQIAAVAAGLDLIGFWCSGPVVRAVAHNHGLFLFESRDAYFFDYSIFTVSEAGENKAVKGFFSEPEWDPEGWAARWERQLSRQKDDLELLRRPSRRLQPGSYRVYLAPGAVNSVLETLKGGGFSGLTYRHGQSPLKDFIEGRRALSPLVSFTENFALGFAPRFNRYGEIPPERIALVNGGRYAGLLVSGKTAREFGIDSNGAEDAGWETEMPRSLEMAPGDMPVDQALARLGTGVWVNEVHYTNFSDLKTARITGMTRYDCFWVENGRRIAPIEDLRFDVSVYDLFGEHLEALTQERQDFADVGTYYLRMWSGTRVPGLLAREFGFTL